MKARLSQHPDSDVAVCSVVKAELYFGAAQSTQPATTISHQSAFLSRFVSFSFDDRAAAVYGPLRATLSQIGQLIGPNDLLIAAIALANQLTLVTNNTAEFSRVLGLPIETWDAAGP